VITATKLRRTDNENAAAAGPQNLILEMLQFLFAVGNVANQRILLFFQFWSLFAYNIAKQLRLKTSTHIQQSLLQQKQTKTHF